MDTNHLHVVASAGESAVFAKLYNKTFESTVTLYWRVWLTGRYIGTTFVWLCGLTYGHKIWVRISSGSLSREYGNDFIKDYGEGWRFRQENTRVSRVDVNNTLKCQIFVISKNSGKSLHMLVFSFHFKGPYGIWHNMHWTLLILTGITSEWFWAWPKTSTLSFDVAIIIYRFAKKSIFWHFLALNGETVKWVVIKHW